MGSEIGSAKGYVVRGKRGSDGAEIAAWTHDGGIGSPVSAARFRTPGQACGAADALTYRGCTDVSIFRVHADGREERLPSYEEALDRLGKLEGALSDAARSPLAALEAAERRLLEAGGWIIDGDRCRDAEDGRWCERAYAIEIERERRLAAKGDA